MANMMNTQLVIIVFSFLVGQVTFLTSPITSRTYWAGLIVAIVLNCFLLRLNRAEARSLISAHPRPKSAGPGKRGPPAAWLAGVEGLEPPTPGFGDRCSSSLATLLDACFPAFIGRASFWDRVCPYVLF